MGTQEVKLERAGEKSAVDSSDPVCSFIHNRPKSSGRVTHDSHKLQTKAIHHSTRHYMNRRDFIISFPSILLLNCKYRVCTNNTDPHRVLYHDPNYTQSAIVQRKQALVHG